MVDRQCRSTRKAVLDDSGLAVEFDDVLSEKKANHPVLSRNASTVLENNQNVI